MKIGHEHMKPLQYMAIGLALCCAPAFAQTRDENHQPVAPTKPATTSMATNARPMQPAQPVAATTGATDPKASPAPNAGEQLLATVIEVKGTVEYAAGDADVLDTQAWKPVTPKMKIASDTQIRTGMRSHCTLQFGEGLNITVIQLRRATLAKISDYRRTINEQRIRIGLGYGAVRGGSSEGTLRSDVVVDSTVATLAKRGTEGWEIEIEPVSGTFHISLARSGLVEAFSKDARERRGVLPGEYATSSNIARMWINQEIFDRAVGPYEVQSLSPGEVDFMVGETTGYASLGTGGSQVFGTGTRRPSASGRGGGSGFQVFPTMIFERVPVQRPEGNFGFGPTFRVLVPRSDVMRATRHALSRTIRRR